MKDKLKAIGTFECLFAKTLRKKLKIRQNKMASLYSVKATYLSRYENGETHAVSPIWLYIALLPKDKLNRIFELIKGELEDGELQVIFEYWRKEFEQFNP